LVDALEQFSKQTGLQFGAELTTPVEQQQRVDAVIGRFTAAAALDKLLADTELIYVWQDDATVRIYKGVVPPEGEGGAACGAGDRKSPGRRRGAGAGTRLWPGAD
jgi:hypothetical protein